MPQSMYIQIMIRIQIEQIEFIYLEIHTHRNTHTTTTSPSNNTIKEKQPMNFKESKKAGYMGKFTKIKWKR